MYKNKNIKIFFKNVLIVFSMAVFMFSVNARPAYALFGVGDINFSNVISDIPARLIDIYDRIRQVAGSRAFHQALRSVTYKLAQDSAVWLASGDKGRKPLVFQQSFGDALSEIGDEVGGKFLSNISAGTPVNLCRPESINSKLKFTIGVSSSIRDVDIFEDSDISRDTGTTGCTLSDIGNNFQQVYEVRKDALAQLSKGFEIDKNPLGAFIKMQEYLRIEKDKKEEQEKSERQGESLRPVKDIVTGQIITPKSVVEETITGAARKAIEPDTETTGDALTDAFQIFANTFAQTYLRRLQKGLLNPQPSRSPGSITSGIEGSPASRAALLAEYDAFSPTRAMNIYSPGEINLFSEMISCPENQYQTPYNCLLNDNLQQAIQQELTVKQSMESGLISPNMMFPEEHVGNQANLSFQNLQKLRFLRVIPVGWEIAAQRLNEKSIKVPFSKLLSCFEDSEYSNDNKKPEVCPKNDEGENILYHLVDPQWILDLPQQYCRAQGYSPIPEHEKSPNRKQLCVDLQSCVKEDYKGGCLEWGYCTRERNTWQLDADLCESQFVTCKTFARDEGSYFSVLASSVDTTGCNERGAAGCKWYSTEEQTDGIWDSSKRIYLNSQARFCSSQYEGTREIIPLMSGVNIVKNGGFDEFLIAQVNNRAPEEGGWQFGNNFEEEFNRDLGAVSPESEITQQLQLKPYTSYNLSFYILSFSESSAQVKIEELGLEETISSDTGRYSFNFYSGSSDGTVSATLSLGSGALYDDIQIMEININDLEAYSARAPEFREYGYDSNGRDLRQAFSKVQECSAKEASARNYTLASDPSVIKTARLTENNLCLSECDGMDSFLAMPTSIEKLAYSSALPVRKSFISEYAEECSSQYAGCEVFTNMSEPDEEKREYYSRIESCVTDTNPNIETFYTWDAGQLKAWQLLKDSSGGPCVNFPQGQITNPETQSCESIPSEKCDIYSDALCRTFINESGQEFLRDANKIVTASNECTEFRRTEDQGSWYFIPSEANKCPASAQGCRQYKGKIANISEIIFESTFEDENDNGIDESDEYPWIDGEIVDESVNQGGHSYRISKGVNNDINVQDYSGKFDYPLKKTFRLTFKAKSKNSGGIIDLIRFKIDPPDGESGATDKEFVGTDDPIDLTQEWREYTVGPLYYSSLADIDGYGEVYDLESPIFLIRAQNSDVFIDDIKLEEIKNNYYFIDSSILPEIEGGNQPNACYTLEGEPKYSQCHAYNDQKNNTYYVEQFDELFTYDAILCVAAIDTQNYSSPYGAVFNEGDHSEYEVGADELKYLKLDSKTQLSNAGCEKLGLFEDANWRDVYKIVDPDEFSSTMCKAASVGCETFTSNNSEYTFRDPAEDGLCVWDPDEGKFMFGSVVCPSYMAKSCATEASGRSSQDSCTAYLPASDDLTEGPKTAIYALSDSLSVGECGGEQDLDSGCIEFTVNPSSIVSSDLPGFEERTQIIQAEFKRECAEWLDHTTTSRVDDPTSNTERVIGYELGRCQKFTLDSEGARCSKWVEVSDEDFPSAYRSASGSAEEFDISDYQGRYINNNLFSGAWDYSGYSIPGQYPVEYLREQGNGILSFRGSGEEIELSCRSYPEEDSPFSRGSISERESYDEKIDYGRNNAMTYLNLCEKQETTEDGIEITCDCGYKKIDAFDQTIYMPNYSIDSLPEQIRSIAEYEGWYGYCLQYDKDSLGPNGKPACLAWWPTDVVRGKPNIFQNHPEAGFAISQPLYYCLAAKGNKIESPPEEFDLEYQESKNNNYIIKVDTSNDITKDPLSWGFTYKVNQNTNFGIPYFKSTDESEKIWAHTLYFVSTMPPNHDNLQYNKPFYCKWSEDPELSANGACEPGTVEFVEHGFDRNGWNRASGILPFPVSKKSPLFQLHEYDIEKIILKKPSGESTTYSDWPSLTEEVVLQRKGWTNTGEQSESRWTAIWCSGDSCDFEEYSWKKMRPFLTDGVESGEEDEEGMCGALAKNSNTNLFVIRAIFADENGDFPHDYFKNIKLMQSGGQGAPFKLLGWESTVGHADPYQFLGFEGGVCDGSDNEGWAPFDIYFQLREYCTDVALVSDLRTGGNKAWTARLNKMSSTSTDTSKYIASENKLTGLYIPDNFTYSQDNAPFGSMVPPAQTIYNPEEWDSRIDEKIDDYTGDKTILEPGKQPLYIESDAGQVRGGSPYACTGTITRCLFPPIEIGSEVTLYTEFESFPDSESELSSLLYNLYLYPISYLKEIYAKIYKFWKWDALNNDNFGYRLLEGFGEHKLSEYTNEGECPVIMSVGEDIVFNKENESEYYNLPNDGNCKTGRYSVSEHTVAGSVSDIVKTVEVGEEISLKFYAFNYNGEQLPLKKIEIDWQGDGTYETIISSNFKNHRPDCQEDQNYGQSSQACESEPFEFKHVYTEPGFYSPIVRVTDNWGRSTRALYSFDRIIEVISDFDAYVEIIPPNSLSNGEDINVGLDLKKTDPNFSLDKVYWFKISYIKSFDDGRVGSKESEYIKSSITEYKVNYETDLAKVSFFTQACSEDQHCGMENFETIGYPPYAVENLSADNTTPNAEDDVVFNWDKNFRAEYYKIRFDEILSSAEGTVNSSYIKEIKDETYLYSYKLNLKSVTAKVQACNTLGLNENCGDWSNSVEIFYTPPIIENISFNPALPEFGNNLKISWDLPFISDSATLIINKEIGDGDWSGDESISNLSDSYTLEYSSPFTAIRARVFSCNGQACSEASEEFLVEYRPPGIAWIHCEGYISGFDWTYPNAGEDVKFYWYPNEDFSELDNIYYNLVLKKDMSTGEETENLKLGNSSYILNYEDGLKGVTATVSICDSSETDSKTGGDLCGSPKKISIGYKPPTPENLTWDYETEILCWDEVQIADYYEHVIKVKIINYPFFSLLTYPSDLKIYNTCYDFTEILFAIDNYNFGYSEFLGGTIEYSLCDWSSSKDYAQISIKACNQTNNITLCSDRSDWVSLCN